MSGIRYRRGLYWGQIENVELLSQIKTNERFAIKDNEAITLYQHKAHSGNLVFTIPKGG